MNKQIQSPCKDQCCLDENDICLGCFRSIDEIIGWHQASDESKLAIIGKCKKRKQQHKNRYGKQMKDSITFYQRFVADILTGNKTITIRNETDKDFVIDSVIKAITHETGDEFAQLRVVSMNPISFSDLNDSHAQQENMSLKELKHVIQEIYPNTEQLYIISFQLQKVKS